MVRQRRDGKYAFFGTDEETLTGPERAMGIAHSADSRTNWGDNFVLTEPVPGTVDDDLWWHIEVSPTDFTDVIRNVFVNTGTGETLEIRNDRPVRQFIRGEQSVGATNDSDSTVEPAPDDWESAYYVVVTDSDGSVRKRIPVERGQHVSIIGPDDERGGGTNETAA
ncbi:MAG: hypothetical protein ACI9TI_000913 [Natronomonas sp.]